MSLLVAVLYLVLSDAVPSVTTLARNTAALLLLDVHASLAELVNEAGSLVAPTSDQGHVAHSKYLGVTCYYNAFRSHGEPCQMLRQ